MYQEYLELYHTYRAKYGEKTAIFLMVGSFYELYDIQDTETGETQANVRDIVDYLGIQLSTKKGDVGQGKDGLFAGFPDYVMHKWAGRLTSTGWTVVIVDQIKDVRGKVKERKVSRILSPSTHVENMSATETPYVATLFFQESKMAPLFGSALLDLTTGSTLTFSGQTVGSAEVWTADELVQLLSVHSPKEVMVHWKGLNPPDAAWFRRSFGLTCPIHVRSLDTLGSFAHDLVRTEYLQQLYCIKSILPVRTYLGLRTEEEETALLYLLQFVEEHHPSMLKSFHRNEPWTPHTRLICGNHALTQLQMTGPQSVLTLFDKCITVMGKRAIKERLLSPSCSTEEIRHRLAEVREYGLWPEAHATKLERQLRFMFDLPRLHRRLLCGLVTASEIAGLFQTYDAIQQILPLTHGTTLQAPFSDNQWASYQAVFQTHVVQEKAQQASADMTPFHPSTYPDIGQKEKEIQDLLESFQCVRKELAKAGGVSEEALRMEEREKEPYGIKASSITLQQLKKNQKQLPEGTKISELKSGGWVEVPAWQQLNTALQKKREALEHLVRIHVLEACQVIAESGTLLWPLMEQWVCHVDGTQCISRVSRERGFTCPEIQEEEGGSYVEIQQLRHPLVEAMGSRVSYVKHDVQLGRDTKGWLIYGMNASGKSTLMKATGLCILLAQAGCYVPAKSMTLRPFHAVYTRILNQDNLFAGLSSFAVEMSELRDILRNADPYTLVLGDELCAGTESTSAQALVASGIQWLSKRDASFMFATHLHSLPDILDLKKERTEVWHLHVEYDPQTKKLVYDRSLRPGSGSSMYGLEVARAMDLPFEFMEQALQNRHRILGSRTQEEATSSAWNAAIVRRKCEQCGNAMQLEVHHVKPRASATQGLLEDGTHMNHASNLMVICQACHDAIHAETLVVHPLQMTSDGPERVIKVKNEVNEVNEVKEKKGKWSEEELETVKETLNRYSSLSLKAIRAHLHSKHGIEMSETVLGKMRRH